MPRIDAAATVRLNAFQRLIYRWSELHPYNAAHALRLAGPLDVPRLQQALADTWVANDLGMAELLPDGRHFRVFADEDPTLEVVPAHGDPEGELARHIAREMNYAYPRPICRPFRVAAIEAGPAAHYLVLTYDHWAADSITVRLILRQLLARYRNMESGAKTVRLEYTPHTYRRTFRSQLRPWALLSASLRMLRMTQRHRHDVLVPCPSIQQTAVGFELYPTAPGTVARLAQFAHNHSATVGDVFLAALTRGLARAIPRRTLHSGSQHLVAATIADIRRDAEVDLENKLGTFLSYYVVRSNPQEHPSLASLTQAINAITRPMKARHGGRDAMVNMGWMNFLWNRMQPQTRPHFLRRTLAISGGISNVLLRDPQLEAQLDDQAFDYVRAAPTGPTLPLTISPTTVGQRLNVGITYRLTSFPRDSLDRFVQSLLSDLEQPEQAGRLDDLTYRRHAAVQREAVL